jgi:Ca2+-binding EF-hand superfamily protein
LARIDESPSEWDRTTERLFRRLDADGSGELTAHELGEALHVLGVKLTFDEIVLFVDQCVSS